MSKNPSFVTILTQGYTQKYISLIPFGIIQIIVKFYGDYNTSFESDIIPNVSDKLILMKMLCNQLNNTNIQLNRLYSSKNDSPTSEEFHKKCDNKGATISIIKSSANENTIFGGYSSISWQITHEYASDKHAFLFQLKPKTQIFTQRNDDGFEAVYHGKLYLINFGGGDLLIRSPCNIDNNHCQPFMYDFKSGSDITGGIIDNEFNELKSKFTVLNLETFQVVSE